MKPKTFIIKTIIVLGIIGAIAWCFEKGFLRFNYPSRDDFPIHGIDISHHQGDIDWDVLKQQNIQFIYMKATEGGDWVDPKFKLFWQSATDREMIIGAYHFYRICKTGKEQANNFIKVVPKDASSMPHVIDLEYMGNCKTKKTKIEILKEISNYISEINNFYGKPPLIYVTEEFYDHYLSNQLMKTKIWIRNIFHKPELADGREWTMWQYSNRGRVDGIENNVDLNVFYGTKAQFSFFIKQNK